MVVGHGGLLHTPMVSAKTIDFVDGKCSGKLLSPVSKFIRVRCAKESDSSALSGL